MFALILGTQIMLLSNPPIPSVIWSGDERVFPSLSECETAGRSYGPQGYKFRCEAR